MVRLISQIISSPVILFQEMARVGEISQVIIDPKDGAFIGLEVLIKVGFKKYIPISEIKGMGDGMVMIKDINSFSEPDEVIKIKKVLKNAPLVVGSRVITEEGQRIGKVNDATLNLDLLALEKLYVTPVMSIRALSKDIIIPAKDIIKINQKDIIIKSDPRSKVSQDLPNMAPAVD